MAVAERRAQGTEKGQGGNSSSRRKSLTIGAVCKILGQEFEDISISKIRYLEDQKLLSPRRTEGGYRLYSQADVERLREILRMQRDEFLPLRVIRQELAAGRDRDPAKRKAAGPRRRAVTVETPTVRFSSEEVTEQTGADDRGPPGHAAARSSRVRTSRQAMRTATPSST